MQIRDEQPVNNYISTDSHIRVAPQDFEGRVRIIKQDIAIADEWHLPAQCWGGAGMDSWDCC